MNSDVKDFLVSQGDNLLDAWPPTPWIPPRGGFKADAGKVNLALLPFEALTEVGKVLTFGEEKYDAHNWRKGFVYSRLIAASMRHMFAFVRGEDNDPESGLSHLAHAATNILFLLTFMLTKTGSDDRYKA